MSQQKVNMEDPIVSLNKSNGIMGGNSLQEKEEGIPTAAEVPACMLKEIVGPLIQEVCNLKDLVHADYSKLENIISNQQLVISKLESTVTSKQNESTTALADKVEINMVNIRNYMEENQQLHKENQELKDQLTKIELRQLGNNVIINGMDEQPWECYETTKERVYDTIAAAMGIQDKNEAMVEARKIEISCCSRTGRYQLNKPRPISVMFWKRDDKQKLLEMK